MCSVKKSLRRPSSPFPLPRTTVNRLGPLRPDGTKNKRRAGFRLSGTATARSAHLFLDLGLEQAVFGRVAPLQSEEAHSLERGTPLGSTGDETGEQGDVGV